MGVVSAILKFANVDMYMTGWNAAYGEAIAILPYIAIIAFITGTAMKVKTDKNA